MDDQDELQPDQVALPEGANAQISTSGRSPGAESR